TSPQSNFPINAKWEDYAHYALKNRQSFSKTDDQIAVGLSLSVVPQAPKGTGTLLIEAAIKWKDQLGLKTLRYGIRTPSFYKYKDKMDYETYVQRLEAMELKE